MNKISMNKNQNEPKIGVQAKITKNRYSNEILGRIQGLTAGASTWK